MNGDIAAARAFLGAGNTKLALEHAEKALTQNPGFPPALDVYCDILLKLERYKALEAAALDWVGKHPQDARPYTSLLLCYAQRKDRKLARALVDHFKAANPHNARDIEFFEAAYQTKFGDVQEGFAQLAKAANAQGDKRSEFTLSAYAALAKANLGEAIKEAEFARRTGEATPENAALLAMLNFRTFRFAKCRMYARMALKDRPQMPIPLELMVLSWAVFLPPFLVAHAMLALLTYINRSTIAFVLVLMMGTTASAPILGLVQFLMRPFGLDGWPSLLLLLAWIFYAPCIGVIAGRIYGGKPKDVKLADY